MKMLSPLVVASAIALLSLSLPAQERIPDSYLQELATIVKEVAEEMTPAQIAEAQAKATIWSQHHPPRPR